MPAILGPQPRSGRSSHGLAADSEAAPTRLVGAAHRRRDRGEQELWRWPAVTRQCPVDARPPERLRATAYGFLLRAFETANEHTITAAIPHAVIVAFQGTMTTSSSKSRSPRTPPNLPTASTRRARLAGRRAHLRSKNPTEGRAYAYMKPRAPLGARRMPAAGSARFWAARRFASVGIEVADAASATSSPALIGGRCRMVRRCPSRTSRSAPAPSWSPSQGPPISRRPGRASPSCST
jgi:hypothetical protein